MASRPTSKQIYKSKSGLTTTDTSTAIAKIVERFPQEFHDDMVSKPESNVSATIVDLFDHVSFFRYSPLERLRTGSMENN